MANQIALRVLAQPGDLVVAGRHQHVVSFEMGAAARNSGIQFATVDDRTACSTLADVDGRHRRRERPPASRGDSSPSRTRTCSSGGAPWDVEDLRATRARDRGPLRSISTARDCSTPSSRRARAPREYAAPATTVMTVSLEGALRAGGLAARGSGDADGRARVERKRLGRRDAPGRLPRRGRSGRARHDGRAPRGGPRASAPTRRALRRRVPRVELRPRRRVGPTSSPSIIPEARQIVERTGAPSVSKAARSRRRACDSSRTPGSSDDDVDFVADVLTRRSPATTAASAAS